MLKDLKHKERTVKDLATFLNNRPGEYKQALYCMLIGAGASVTSGIRTGQDLIKVWRRQVLKKYDPNIDIENFNDDEIKSKIYKFYSESDKENEYSALFGKIYDLKAQRRNFIEQEVAKAISPSIGYQYLNILAEEKYIQTFFTTNFDDLLELALSPLSSKNRPVVCAQDSSVSNISITSQRTKIIKLHGDFLYNDLRSSKDETESLEKNMKEKFTEFLKNYGLIVLGYAGNDKSIMDCLFDLLGSKEKKDSKVKKDVQNNYLNNGLYWCITRKDYENNNISTKVLNLLSEEKVYYVIIDGFDEFCAELTHELYSMNNKGNVLFHKSHERQFQELEEYYKEQKEKFQDNLLILNDIKNCMSDTTNNGTVSKTATELSNNKFFEDSSEKQSEVDNAVTKDIKKLINRKDYNEALNLINNEIFNNKLPSFLQNYYNLLKIECQVSLKQVDAALNTIEEAISYNDKTKKDSNVQLYYEKSLLAKNRSERIQAIREAINIDKYSYNLWNRLAEELIDNEFEHSKNKAEILECYKKSIDLNNASDNDAYIDRILFLKDETDDNNQELIDICDETIRVLQEKDPYSIAFLKANFEKIESQIKYSKDSDIKFLKDQAKEVFDTAIKNNQSYERNLFYTDMYLIFCSKQCDLDELKNVFSSFDEKYSDDIMYIIQKAKIHLRNFRNLSYAISILENIDLNIIKYSFKDRDNYYYLYIKYLLYDNQCDKAYKIYNENVTQNMRKARTLEADILFNIDRDKYVEYINKEFDESTKSTQDLIAYTYGLLNVEEYDKIYEICKVLLQPNNVEIDSNNPILQINYNMAKKYGSKQSKINQTNLEQIFTTKNDPFVKAAGYMLINEINNAEKIFKEELIKNYENFYSHQKMPVFKSLNFDNLKLEPLSKN